MQKTKFLNLKEKKTQQKLQVSTNTKGELSHKTSLLTAAREWRWMLLHCDTCRWMSPLLEHLLSYFGNDTSAHWALLLIHTGINTAH